MSVFSRFLNKTGLKSVLQSKLLLYFLVFIAFFDFVFLSLEKDFIFAGIFIIIGFLTSFFNKNMIVILFTTVILTNILRFGKDVRVHEGMEDGDPNSEEKIEENMADPTDSIEYIEPDEPVSKTALTKKTPVAPVPADNYNNKLTKFSSPSGSPSGDYSAENIQSLLENQKQIMQNMNDLAPLLKQAETFLSSPIQ
jgi:hypothetical protein